MTYHITFLSIFLSFLTLANPSQFSSFRPIDLSLQNPTSAAEDVQIPRSLSYQGKLTDDQGNPVPDSTYSITFRLFNVPSGGTAYWSETQSIQTRGGLFHTLLGSITPIPYIPIDGNCYLEMQVNPNPAMAPRIRIVSSGYSYLAKRADSANYALPIGTAGGDLTGNYPNPAIADNAVTTTKIADANVTLTKINPTGSSAGQVLTSTGPSTPPTWQTPTVGPHTHTLTHTGDVTGSGDVSGTWALTIANNAVTSAKIQDGTILGGDINQMGATTGQVLKWSGTTWAPANDLIGGDNAWVRETPDSVLFTIRQLGIARGGSGNILYGNNRFTHTNFGVLCTTGASGQNYYSCTVGGGLANAASGDYATVSGGFNNNANNLSATVSGGRNNDAFGSSATISGGNNNAATNTAATVGGGRNNQAGGHSATVGGGAYNNASGDSSTIGGGSSNLASGRGATIGGGSANSAESTNATIGGGRGHIIRGRYGTIGGGLNNFVYAPFVTIGGGDQNGSESAWATIGGGQYNAANGGYAAVGGGFGNTARGRYATISGGDRNATNGFWTTIGGGQENLATSEYATIGGGQYNTAGNVSTIGGGSGNEALGGGATIGGGYENIAPYSCATIGGGSNNLALGPCATIGGGYSNYALYYATVAGGRGDTSAGYYSFTTNNHSVVLSSYTNSSAFNGQTATASGQTRVGILAKSSGTFTIDHPLDPENKILNHYFVESPEMRNIYEGSIFLNENGRAVVYLPDYFSALNRNPHIQLTGVGTAEVYVAEEVLGNRFVIGGKPGTKVYWMVTGERKDRSAEITKILMPVEQKKEGGLRGRMLDEDFLVTTKGQLDEMGYGSRFQFLTPEAQKRYEAMKNPIFLQR